MKKINLALIGLLSLTACQGNDVRETLGLKIDAPDEFAVERKPRLDVPPSFQLRPPAPGEGDVNAVSQRDLAREKIIGGNGTVLTTASKGENALLSKAGATSANPEIRATLSKEVPADLTTLEKIRSISDKEVGKTLVDAEKEKERIAETKKENKPITEGETPTKSVSDGKSVIDKIFN